MMQIWKTTSFIAWRDSELHKSSKVSQSRVSATRKSSQKVSNASTLYTHHSKGHEKSIWLRKPHSGFPRKRRAPQLRRSLSVLAKARLHQLWWTYRPNRSDACRTGGKKE